tara:strand:- start:283 stop:471 length:189 start_codon:yes stop_codon:yes gene_type:complete
MKTRGREVLIYPIITVCQKNWTAIKTFTKETKLRTYLIISLAFFAVITLYGLYTGQFDSFFK